MSYCNKTRKELIRILKEKFGYTEKHSLEGYFKDKLIYLCVLGDMGFREKPFEITLKVTQQENEEIEQNE